MRLMVQHVSELVGGPPVGTVGYGVGFGVGLGVTPVGGGLGGGVQLGVGGVGGVGPSHESGRQCPYPAASIWVHL